MAAPLRHCREAGAEQPPTHPTREPTTDRHTLDRFRASEGRTLAPSGMPHALGPQPDTLAALGCARA